jgi:hypothetical protein
MSTARQPLAGNHGNNFGAAGFLSETLTSSISMAVCVDACGRDDHRLFSHHRRPR